MFVVVRRSRSSALDRLCDSGKSLVSRFVLLYAVVVLPETWRTFRLWQDQRLLAALQVGFGMNNVRCAYLCVLITDLLYGFRTSPKFSALSEDARGCNGTFCIVSMPFRDLRSGNTCSVHLGWAAVLRLRHQSSFRYLFPALATVGRLSDG